MNSRCSLKNQTLEQKHLVISAKSHQADFARCFKNYLKFEKNKKQKMKICHLFNVNKNGKVIYARVFGLSKKRLPNDFRMCLEQQLWMLNFTKLQLEKSYLVKFPLEFISK